jgi:hypothetical protein
VYECMYECVYGCMYLCMNVCMNVCMDVCIYLLSQLGQRHRSMHVCMNVSIYLQTVSLPSLTFDGEIPSLRAAAHAWD